MDILLINAPVTVRNEHARLTPPLGLAYIASSLMSAGHRVSALDMNVSGLNLDRLAGAIRHDRPSIVGISAHTETYTNALAIARCVKQVAPRTAVVLGGAHATILPEAVIAEEDVDWVVAGAGERTMVELADHVIRGLGELAAMPGLVWIDEAGEVHVNERAELPHPDDLPLPARHLFPMDFYRDKWNVLTATGSCPFRCPFCSAASVWQGRRRLRSPESIVAELRLLQRDNQVDHVFFTDDIFTLNKRWVLELVAQLHTLERPLEWGCATRVDMVDRELLEAMAGAGCRGIQFGVESGCQDVLDQVKGIRKEDVLAAVDACASLGIDAVSSFIVPFPEDTHETLAETAAFIRRVREAGSRVLLSYTCPYPGTTFYAQAEELGINILTDRWEEYDAKHVTMETRHLSAAEIEAHVEAIAADVGLERSVS